MDDKRPFNKWLFVKKSDEQVEENETGTTEGDGVGWLVMTDSGLRPVNTKW